MKSNQLKSIALVGTVFISALFINRMSSEVPDDSLLNLPVDDGSALASVQGVPKPEQGGVAGIGAAAYGVYSLNGTKIYGSGENKRWPIASITKLMTAVVARDVFDSAEKFEVTAEHLLTEGNSTKFTVGEVFSFADIEKALLMTSSNVAGEILATKHGRDRFIAVMNNYAYNFGMSNTKFFDPTGLSYQNQSTVEDLDKLATYILNKKPEIFTATRKKSDKILNIKSGKRREIVNINPYSGRADFIGGKTGTTPEAVGNLISIFGTTAVRPGRVIILLGTENRFDETDNILNSWNSSTRR